MEEPIDALTRFGSSDALHSAANDLHSHKSKSRGCAATVKSWYSPTVDYKAPKMTDEQKAKAPRYCNGRMRKWQFICCHITLFLLLVLVIMTPILYLVIVPNFIQATLDNPPANMDLTIGELKVTQFSADSLSWKVNITVGAVTVFPINGGVGAMDIHAFANSTGILSVALPQQDYWLNQPITVLCEGRVDFSSDEQKGMNDFLTVFSKVGLENVIMGLRFNAPLRVFGLTMYSGLPLHKNIALPNLKADFKSVMDYLYPPTSGSKLLADSKDVVQPSLIRKLYPVDDIISLTPSFDIVWSKLDLKVQDSGPVVQTGLTFENLTPIGLNTIQNVVWYLSLQGSRFIRFSLNAVQLNPSVQDLALAINMDFLGDMLDPLAGRKAIEDASSNFANNGDIDMSLSGPFGVEGASFLSAMTPNFDFQIRLKDVLAFVSNNATDSASNFLAHLNFTEILGNSSIALNVTDKITAVLGLQLPVFLAIPRVISFPYTAGLSIYGQAQKTLSGDLDTVMINRTDSAIIVNTTFVMTPVNTADAALALANALNPILSNTPVVSSIGLKDLIVAPVGGAPYNFTSELFNPIAPLNFSLPALTCADCLVGQFLSTMEMNSSSSLPFSVVTLAIAQMNDRPGFEAKGKIDVVYPANYPRAQLAVGFFHVDTTIEDAGFVGLELPTGLNFYPAIQGTNIDGAAIVARDDFFADKAQRLIDALLLKHDLPSYMGLTGLSFGADSSAPVMTFAQIKVGLSTELLPIIGNSSTSGSGISISSLTDSLPAGFIKIQGADVNLKTSENLALGVQTYVNNDFKISLSMGTLQVDAILEDGRLVTLDVNPFNLLGVPGALDLSPVLTLATGANGMDQKVAELVNAVLATNPTIDMLAGITRLSLTPVAPTNDLAKIDQLSPLKIQVHVSTILDAMNSPSSSSKGSIIDTSAILPSNMTDLLNSFNPQINQVNMAAAANASLNAGGDFNYTNPLPLSAVLPYLALSASVKDTPTIKVALSGIQLARLAGSLQPSLGLGFLKGDSIPDNVAELVHNFFAGSVNPGLGVSGIYFGSSVADQNDLLNRVSVDVTSYAQPLADNGPDMLQKINQYIDDMLNGNTPSVPIPDDALIAIQGPMGINASINQLGVVFQPASKINAGVNGTFAAPFVATVDIPFMNAGLALDELNLMNLVLGLAVGGNGPLGLTTEVGINDNDPVAIRIARIVDDFQNGVSIPGDANGNNILVGLSAMDNIDTFSKISAGLSIDKLANVLRNSGNSSSSFVTDLIKKLDFSLTNAGLQAQPGQTLQVSAAASLTNKFGISVEHLGYMGASAGLDYATIVDISLPSGIEFAHGKNDLSLGLDLGFLSGDDIQNRVAAFAKEINDNGFGNTKEEFTANSIRFGYSPQDYIKILSRAQIGMASASILNNDTFNSILNGTNGISFTTFNNDSLVDIKGPFGLNLTVGQAALEFMPKSAIGTNLTGGVESTFNLTIGIPYFTGAANLNSLNLMSLLLGVNINMPGPLGLATGLTFNDVEEVATSIANIFDFYQQKKAIPGTLGGGKLALGIDETDCIQTFEKVEITYPIDKLAQAIRDMSTNSTGSVTDMLKKLMDKLDLSLGQVSMAAESGRIIGVNAAAGLNNSFGISVKNLGYVGASAGLNETDVLSLAIPNLGLDTGRNNLSLALDIHFPSSEEIKDAVKLFGDHLTVLGVGNTPDEFSASKVGFGFSADDHIKILSKARLSVASASLINNDTLSLFGNSSGIAIETSDKDLIVIRGPFGINITVGGADMAFLPDSFISLNVNGDVQSTVGLNVSLPYFVLGCDLNELRLLDASVGLNLLVPGPLGVGTGLAINDNAEVADSIAAITDRYMSGLDILGTIGGGHIMLGSSSAAADVIDTFEKLSLGYPIDSLVNMFSNSSTNGTSGLFNSIYKKLGLSFAGLTMDAKPNHALEAGFSAGLNSTFNVTVSGLGYINAAGGLDETDIVSIGLAGLSLVPGKSNLSLSLNMTFPSEESIQTKVADFGKHLSEYGIGNTKELVAAHAISFGMSEADHIKILSKARIGIHSSSLINNSTVSSIIQYVQDTLAGSSANISEYVSNIVVDTQFNPSKVINANLGAALNLPWDISVNLPYVGFGTKVANASAFDLLMTGLTVKSGANNITISNGITVHDNDDLALSIAAIADAYFKSLPLPGTFGGGFALFGLDQANAIDSFSKLDIDISLEKAVDFVSNVLTKNGTVPISLNVTSILDSLNVSLANVAVAAKANRSIGTTLDASFANAFDSFKVSIKGLSYMHGAGGLDTKDIVILQSDSAISVVPGENQLSFAADLVFPSSSDIQDEIAQFAKDLVSNGLGKTTQNITASKVAFGYDQASSFQFLSKVVVAINSSKVLNEDNLKYLTDSMSSLNLTDVISFKSVDAEFPASPIIDVTASATLKLPFNVTVSMPYFTAGSRVQQVDFAALAINGLAIQGPNTELSVGTDISINDTPELADTIAALVKAVLASDPNAGTIGGGNILFGLSKEDSIDSFAKVSVDIDAQKLVNLTMDFLNGTNIFANTNSSTLEAFNLSVTDLTCVLEPLRNIKIGAGVGFSNTFELTINGLGYLAGDLGIDTNQFVVMSSDGVSVAHGTNDVKLGAQLNFPQGESIQDSLRDFVDHLINLPGIGKTVEKITAGGIGFGHSPDNHFRFLSKTDLGLSSGDLITQSRLDYIMNFIGNGTFDFKGLTKDIVLNFADIDGTVANTISAKASAGLKNHPMNVDLNIPFATVGSLVNANSLIDIHVDSGITIQGGDMITLTLGSSLLFQNSDNAQLQNDVAAIASAVWNTQPLPGTVGVAGLSFGASSLPSDVIDTFAKVVLSLSSQKVFDFVNSTISSSTGSFALPFNYTIGQVDLDVHNSTTLVANASLALSAIAPVITMKLPHVGVDAAWDSYSFASIQVANIGLANNSATTGVFIDTTENTDVWNQVMPLIGDLTFHRSRAIDNSVSVSGITFGASPETAYRGFSKVNLGMEIDKYYQSAWKYSNEVRPLTFKRIGALMDDFGILGVITALPLPADMPPINLKATRIDSFLTYQLGGTGKTFQLVNAVFDQLQIKPNTPISTVYRLDPIIDYDTGVIQPLQEAIAYLISIEDFARHASIGMMSIHGSTGEVFTPLSRSVMHAPDIVFWNPINVNVQLLPQFPPPIAAVVSFANPGPLSLDVGNILMDIAGGLASIYNIGGLNVLNRDEGGLDPHNIKNNELIIALFTWAWPWEYPAKIMHIIENIANGLMQMHISSDDGQDEFVFLKNLTTQLMTPDTITNVKAHLYKFFDHFSVTVFGIDVTSIVRGFFPGPPAAMQVVHFASIVNFAAPTLPRNVPATPSVVSTSIESSSSSIILPSSAPAA